MPRVPVGAGRLAGLKGLLAVVPLAACSALPAKREAAAPQPPEACVQLSLPYYAIARNKDLGSSKERQLMLVREVAFEDPSTSIESLAFMEHVVELVYSYPEDDAEAIRQRVLADCEIDADGKPVLRTLWGNP